MLVSLFFCTLLPFVHGESFINSITPATTQIALETSYSFNVIRTGSSMPLDGVIQITFPTAYYLPSVPNCSVQFATAVTCMFSNGKLDISNSLTSISALSNSAFTVIVSPVLNPVPASTYSPFYVSILFSNGTIFEDSAISASVAISPGQAICSSVTVGFVFQQGTVTIAYQSQYSPAFLTLTMAQTYADDPTSTNISPSFSVSATSSTNAASYIFEIAYANTTKMNLLMPPSTFGEMNFVFVQSSNSLGTFDSCSVSLDRVLPNPFAALTISSGVVQTALALSFEVTSTTPIQPTDSLTIFFGPAFDLTKITLTTTIKGLGTYPISLLNSTVKISSFSTIMLINTKLVFSLSSITLPTNTQPSPITFAILTNRGYFRDLQTLQYSASLGVLRGSYFCDSTAIGSLTNCTFTLNTSHALITNPSISIVFPFSILSGSYSCPVSVGTHFSLFNCVQYAENSSILIQNIAVVPISPNTLLSLKVQISLPYAVVNFTVSVATLSGGFPVDSLNFSISSTPGLLLPSEFSVTSSSATTYSLTTYSLLFALPVASLNLYTVTVSFPFDVQQGRSIAITNANLRSFANGLLTFDASALNDNFTIGISNMMTYFSIRPISMDVSVVYNNQLFYSGSTVLTMQKARNIATFSVSQSNAIVYQYCNVTFTVSGVSPNDVLVFQNTQYVLKATTSPLTSFTLLLQNIDHIGSVVSSVQIYESNASYLKQVSTATLFATVLNSLAATYLQSNPYYLEPTVYTINVTMRTPSATNLLVVVPNDYAIQSVLCIVNCALYKTVSNALTFNISSTNVIISIKAINPPTFAQLWTFTSSSLQGEKDFSSMKIQPVCASPCRSCLTGNQCATCYNGTSLQNSTCVTSCAPGSFTSFVSSFSTCAACDSKCALCTVTATFCSQCIATSFLLGTSCLLQCPNGYFSDSSRTCIQCLSGCAVCVSQSNCTSCTSGFVFLSNACLSSCPTGTYFLNQQCLVCSNACLSCENVTGLCLICSPTFYLYIGKCYASCPTSVYINVLKMTCEPCNAPCSTCLLESTVCTGCLKQFNSASYFLLGNQCLTTCPFGYFAASSNNSCTLCVSPCITCLSSSACLTCLSNLYYYQFRCYAACPSSTFSTSINSTLVCSSCISVCLTCVSLSTCTMCISQYWLLEGICLAKCPDYYYQDGIGSCLPCAFPCSLCNKNGCLSCTSAYYLQGAECLPSCVTPYHPNNSTMICEACQSPCLACTFSHSCLSCVSNYFLASASCLSVCPTGYYAANGICNACPSQCPTCLYSNQIKCLSCITPYYTYGYSCLALCPANTTISVPNCLDEACSLTNCLSCSGGRCLQCAALYSFDSNYACTVLITASDFLSSIASIPIAFPFLIALVLLCMALGVLKCQFPRMIFFYCLYATAGIVEICSVVLWVTLVALWNVSGLSSDLVSISYAPFLLLFLYMSVNLLQFLHFCCSMRQRSFVLWLRQDNNWSSFVLSAISLAVSHRFEYLRYSRLAQKECFSAPIGDHFPFGPVLSIVVSLGNICVSCYLTYLQSSLNFLFYTGVQVAVIGVCMLLLSVITVILPRQAEKYKTGRGSQSESLEQMEVVEEEHNEFHLKDTGAILIAGSRQSDQSVSGRENQSSQEVLLRAAPHQYGDEEPEVQHYEQLNSQFRLDANCEVAFPKDCAANLLNALHPHEEAFKSALKYLPEEQHSRAMYSKVAGMIVRQLDSLQSPEQLSEPEDFQCFELDRDIEILEGRPPMKFIYEECLEDYGEQPFESSHVVLEQSLSLQASQLKPVGMLVRKPPAVQTILPTSEMELDHQIAKMTQETIKHEQLQRQKQLSQVARLLQKIKLQKKEEQELQAKVASLSQEEVQLVSKEIERQRERIERRRMGLEDRICKLMALSEANANLARIRHERIQRIKNSRLTHVEQPDDLIEVNQLKIESHASNNTFDSEDVLPSKMRRVRVQPPLKVEVFHDVSENLHDSEENEGVENNEKSTERQPVLAMVSAQQSPPPAPPRKNEQKVIPMGRNNLQSERGLQQKSFYPRSSEAWAIEPELEDRIGEIETRANRYIEMELKSKDESSHNYTQVLYDLNETGEIGENGELVFEEQAVVEQRGTVRLPRGRVNRSVINLSPGKANRR